MVACACKINRTGDYYTFKMSTSWHEQAVTVTGSIGSGKSTVCSVFKELGAAVISADELARQAVLPGSQALKEIVLTFGADGVPAAGALVIGGGLVAGGLRSRWHQRVLDRRRQVVLFHGVVLLGHWLGWYR